MGRLKYTKIKVKADAYTDAEKVINNSSKGMVNALTKDLKEFEKALDSARKDLAGLKKAGAGLTEVKTLLGPVSEKIVILASHADMAQNRIIDTIKALD